MKKYSIFLILMLYCTLVARTQERRIALNIDFRINSAVIDSFYSDNAVQLQKIADRLRSLRQDKTVSIAEVSFYGAASPEGSYQLNRRLAQGRLSAFEQFICKKVDIPDSLITRKDSYIRWDYLKSQIEESECPNKQEVLVILNEDGRLVEYYHPNVQIDNRVLELKALDGGKVWFQLSKRFFERMRNAGVVIVTYNQQLPSVQNPEGLSGIDVIEAEKSILGIDPESLSTFGGPVPEIEEWSRKLHLKTNALGLGVAISNIAAEIDLAKHLSFTLPVYYSAWNYFKSTIKFRTFAVQPELRYWLSEENDGFFAGAHLGLAYYNLALNDDYRYQDHSRETPAIGGGLGIGYRFPISRNNRWRVEFSLGAGVYSNHYDKFQNTPETKDGLLIKSVRKTYYGIDQAAVSFSYSFELKKKGGKQ